MKAKSLKGQIEVRAAKGTDYSACLPLFVLLYHGDIGPKFKHIFDEYIEGEGSVILLAKQNHKPIGLLVGSYHLDIDWEGKTAKIDAIIVDKDNRKKGVGKKLTRHFIAIAKKKNCVTVKSRVNVDNVIAQKFHKSLGFAKADTYEYIMDFQK